MKDTARQVQAYMTQKLRRLTATQAEGPMKAALANLRRGIGSAPGDRPELWGLLLEDLPEQFQSADSEPSKAEWAIYTALTLFALHQQGRDPAAEPMNAPGQSLGRAVRGLVPAGDTDAEERVLRRFNQVATAGDMKETAYFLRGLMQLLRAEGLPLDYPELAADLFWFQFPGSAPGIRLKWGQDFYRIRKKEDSAD